MIKFFRHTAAYRRFLFQLQCVALLAVCVPAGAGETVKSPDGNYEFTFSQNSGAMSYDITYKGKTVVDGGTLGIDIDNSLFESALGIPRDTCKYWCSNLALRSVERTERDTIWHPLYGENSEVRDHYNQLTLHLGKGAAENSKDGYDFDKRRFYMIDIEVRAYNEGVAFRYHFPETTNGLFLNIRGERTTFAMPSGTKALYEEWAQGPFEWRTLKKTDKYQVSNGNDSQWTECERPLYLTLPDGLCAVLTEARMRDYARGKFTLDKDNVIRLKMYDGVEVMSPYSTPWRVVMAAEKPVELLNNKDIILSLNDPCELKNTDFIRPGKAYRCGRLERSYIMSGIAFAEKMNFQFIELDARWYGPEMSMKSSALKESPDRNFTVKEVCDSAKKHGLGVWVYVNQRALYQQLDEILPLYKEWGVAGIKFGFVQVGNQTWSTWLHNAVKKCGEYGIMVDIHDEYRSTGISRTLPNLLTQEGIGGNEEMPDAWHNTVLPFTRFMAGAADYTPSYYCNRIKNTRAHQLAMAAVYYSPLQFLFWYDDPKVFDGGEELKFWKDIPTTFDESKALDGAPGEYIVQARRKGNTWFIGVLNSKEARTIKIKTAEILCKKGKYTAEIYIDDMSLNTKSKVKTTMKKIKAGEEITLELQPAGGAAIIIEN